MVLTMFVSSDLDWDLKEDLEERLERALALVERVRFLPLVLELDMDIGIE